METWAHGQDVADALGVGQRPVLHPDRTGEPRQLLVFLQPVLRHGEDETIDIGHESLLR